MTVAWDGAQKFWLKSADGALHLVCTVTQACKVLERTRRQVYRYMDCGQLRPAGKFLGEWLLDQDSVDRLARYRTALEPCSRPQGRSKIR